MKKNMAFRLNKNNIHIFHSVHKFSRPALNAWFLLLKHQRAFEMIILMKMIFISYAMSLLEDIGTHFLKDTKEHAWAKTIDF